MVRRFSVIELMGMSSADPSASHPFVHASDFDAQVDAGMKLFDENERLRAKSAHLAAELADCKSDLAAVENQGDAAHTACEQYEARIVILVADKADLLRVLGVADARIAQLEADIQELTCGDPRLASLKREGPHCPTCSCGLAPETLVKQFTADSKEAYCIHCGKSIGYHYQTAEGNLFCQVPETKAQPSAADIESDLWGEFNRER